MVTGRSYERESYQCRVINRQVTITVSVNLLYQGQLPVATMHPRMEGCSGAHICGLFPNGFHVPPPTGCPYHENLSKGGV